MMTLGIAGAKGSFSEAAAEEYVSAHKLHDYTFIYLVSIEAVLNTLTAKKIDVGIFPIENSNGGVVYEAVYAMARYIFSVQKFFEIDVQHCLLVKTGTKAEDITSITSHDQAIKQCRMYLKRRWQKANIEEYSDTAQAAKDLAAGKLSDTVAVIAPRRAAELYGLNILEANIQDLKFNFTTFIAATS